ncbi:transglycosylase SLT domain-containing protein [bacterium]|nr:transglycosylase SLT domain-containing protein [bacterium]
MRSITSFVLFFSLAGQLLAQGPNLNLTNHSETAIQTVQDQLDSMVVGYFVKKSIERQTVVNGTLDSLFIPEFSDSVLSDRLRRINSLIPLDYNDKTRAFIEMYTRNKRELVPYILALSNYYFPIIEPELDKNNLPLELRFLPVIESALKPNAVSRAGAVGLWQFMYATAKMNGLTITSYVDERRDPIRSTQAACKYLGDLHKMFGDWQLAIAAYNCGPGNVNKAIRRSGGKTNFWEIYNYLPRETRGYVPAFIAAAYFFHYYEDHNIGVADLQLPTVVDTVIVDDYVHLSDLAAEFNLPLELIREMNPQYRADIVPASKEKPYTVILPLEHCLIFCEHLDTLYTQYEVRRSSRTSAPVSYTSSYTASSNAGKSPLYYTVKSGDNLGYIADWYDTYVSTIKAWNGLYSNNIRVGQKLLVYVPNDKVSYYANINAMSFDEKKNISSHSTFASSNTASSGATSTGSAEYFFYTFKSGDTLWDLTQKYPGNSVSSIMALNGIKDVKSIKAGQVIKLKKA